MSNSSTASAKRSKLITVFSAYVHTKPLDQSPHGPSINNIAVNYPNLQSLMLITRHIVGCGNVSLQDGVRLIEGYYGIIPAIAS